MRIASHLWSLIIPLFLSGCDKIVNEKVTHPRSESEKSAVIKPIPKYREVEFYNVEYTKDINSSSGVTGTSDNLPGVTKVAHTLTCREAPDTIREVTFDFVETKEDQDLYNFKLTHSVGGKASTIEKVVAYSGSRMDVWTDKNVHVGIMPRRQKDK